MNPRAAKLKSKKRREIAKYFMRAQNKDYVFIMKNSFRIDKTMFETVPLHQLKCSIYYCMDASKISFSEECDRLKEEMTG